MPPTPPASGFLTTAEAAALLRVHPKQVYRLFARGLPHRRVGDEWRYDRDELLAWAGGGSRAPVSGAAPPPIVASNGDVAVRVLLERASEAPGPLYGSALADREGALAALRRRAVLAAGFHGTAFPAAVPEGRLARLHLVRREVGLVAPRGRTPRLEDATRVRVATRPPTAGVRVVFEEALRAAGITSAAVRRGTEHRSHLDVVSAVARGDADLGIATHAWAAALGLAFLRLADEEFGLLFLAADLGDAAAVRLCETAQRDDLRRALAATAGYDASACGRIHLDPAGAPGTAGPGRARSR